MEVPTRMYSRSNPSKFSSRPPHMQDVSRTLTADVPPENMEPVIPIKKRVARIVIREHYIIPGPNIPKPGQVPNDSRNPPCKSNIPLQADIVSYERKCKRRLEDPTAHLLKRAKTGSTSSQFRPQNMSTFDGKSDGSPSIKSKQDGEATKAMVLNKVFNSNRKISIVPHPASKEVHLGENQFTLKKTPLDNNDHFTNKTQKLHRQDDIVQSSKPCTENRQKKSQLPQQNQDGKVRVSEEADYTDKLDKFFGPISPDHIRQSIAADDDRLESTSDIGSSVRSMDSVGVTSIASSKQGSKIRLVSEETDYTDDSDILFGPISPDDVRQSIGTNDYQAARLESTPDVGSSVRSMDINGEITKSGKGSRMLVSKEELDRLFGYISPDDIRESCCAKDNQATTLEITPKCSLRENQLTNLKDTSLDGKGYSPAGAEKQNLACDGYSLKQLNNGESHEWALKLVEMALLEPLTESSPRFFYKVHHFP